MEHVHGRCAALLSQPDKCPIFHIFQNSSLAPPTSPIGKNFLLKNFKNKISKFIVIELRSVFQDL